MLCTIAHNDNHPLSQNLYPCLLIPGKWVTWKLSKFVLLYYFLCLAYHLLFVVSLGRYKGISGE